MRNLILAAVTVLFAGILVAQQDPAQAYSRVLVHYSPDSGYAPPIIATCNYDKRWGTLKYLYTGQRMSCATKGIYVRAGEEVWCRETRLHPWVKRFDSTGWHKESYYDTAGCELRKD